MGAQVEALYLRVEVPGRLILVPIGIADRSHILQILLQPFFALILSIFSIVNDFLILVHKYALARKQRFVWITRRHRQVRRAIFHVAERQRVIILACRAVSSWIEMEPLADLSVLVHYLALDVLDIGRLVVHDLIADVLAHYSVLVHRLIVYQVRRMQRVVTVVDLLLYGILLCVKYFRMRFFGCHSIYRVLGKTALGSVNLKVGLASLANFRCNMAFRPSLFLQEAETIRRRRIRCCIQYTLACIARNRSALRQRIEP